VDVIETGRKTISYWLCDITKARTLLGFDPRISLALGAKLTVAWYKKENWL
jgi:nucleoside-diphosphate-sugar epimerase